MIWGGTLDKIPAGWLHCDGRLLDRREEQFRNLFEAIQFNFGTSPPPGQFYLPDLRGRFIRGVDAGAGRDPNVGQRTDMRNPQVISKSVGSVQSHAFQQHVHPSSQVFQKNDGNIAYGSGCGTGTDVTGMAETIVFQTSTETRPINAYVHFIIAY
jgi:microcystin-dependent protein